MGWDTIQFLKFKECNTVWIQNVIKNNDICLLIKNISAFNNVSMNNIFLSVNSLITTPNKYLQL